MIKCLLKTLKLAVWALSSNFVHDFTLFVIKIHQNRFISPLLTTGDHFHFRQIWDCFDTITVCPIFLREAVKKKRIFYGQADRIDYT